MQTDKDRLTLLQDAMHGAIREMEGYGDYPSRVDRALNLLRTALRCDKAMAQARNPAQRPLEGFCSDRGMERMTRRAEMAGKGD